LSNTLSGCWFFVAAEHHIEFYTSLLPELVRSYGIDQGSMMLRRAFLAFVRHGHGEDVISEDGDITKDRQREINRERTRRSA
jgi:hypothetical protein